MCFHDDSARVEVQQVFKSDFLYWIFTFADFDSGCLRTIGVPSSEQIYEKYNPDFRLLQILYNKIGWAETSDKK